MGRESIRREGRGAMNVTFFTSLSGRDDARDSFVCDDSRSFTLIVALFFGTISSLFFSVLIFKGKYPMKEFSRYALMKNNTYFQSEKAK